MFAVQVRTANGNAKVPLPNERYDQSSSDVKLALKGFVDQTLAECYNGIYQQSTANLFSTNLF